MSSFKMTNYRLIRPNSLICLPFFFLSSSGEQHEIANIQDTGDGVEFYTVRRKKMCSLSVAVKNWELKSLWRAWQLEKTANSGISGGVCFFLFLCVLSLCSDCRSVWCIYYSINSFSSYQPRKCVLLLKIENGTLQVFLFKKQKCQNL